VARVSSTDDAINEGLTCVNFYNRQ
jgi:hypothetical protein